MPRLAGGLVGLVAGAVGGGLLFLHARSYAPALPLVITSAVILLGWVLDNHRLSTGQQQVLDATAHAAECRR